jgi:hypothetical protein
VDNQTGTRDLRAELIDALRLMALPADDQIAALPSFVVTADEIALTFADVFCALGTPQAAGVFTDGQLATLEDINQTFDAMSQRPSDPGASVQETWTRWTWSHEALRKDPRWSGLRDRAQSLLTMLDAIPGQPRISGVYVPGSVWRGQSDSAPHRPATP